MITLTSNYIMAWLASYSFLYHLNGLLVLQLSISGNFCFIRVQEKYSISFKSSLNSGQTHKITCGQNINYIFTVSVSDLDLMITAIDVSQFFQDQEMYWPWKFVKLKHVLLIESKLWNPVPKKAWICKSLF